jgi:hypothetical protein
MNREAPQLVSRFIPQFSFSKELQSRFLTSFEAETIGQSAYKFFENTRDGELGTLKLVSARLPKNF